MNLPNSITLSRIPLMFVIAALMFCGWVGAPTLAFLLFLVGATGDWLDGYLARRRGIVTSFGKLMDAMADKIMVIGLVVVLVGKMEMPVWLALVVLCREFLVTGMRMVAASKGVVVAADKGGKSKTVTQLIALGFLLGAPVLGRDLAWLLGSNLTRAAEIAHNVGMAIFIIGTILAVWSGWRYITQLKNVVFEEADR